MRSRHIIVHLGMVDEKEDPSLNPTGNYFEMESNKIYITALQRKFHNLRTTRNVLSYCIDDPNTPDKGVIGKRKVKIHEDISYNIQITEKVMPRYVESFEDPMAKWAIDETKNGSLINLEITRNHTKLLFDLGL